MNQHKNLGRNVVVIDGMRTPFLKAGTDYSDLMGYQLGAMAIKGLLEKTGVDKNDIDRLVMGTTVHQMATSNVARECLLAAGLPDKIPANTVTMACISANMAISTAADLIRLGHADVVIAGGTDSVSDTPIGFKKKMRKKLFRAQKLKTTMDMIKFALGLRPSDFAPERPSITEFSTGLTMGQDCDRLAARIGVTREEQDSFAARSHQLSALAAESGLLDAEIVPAEIPPKFKAVSKDNGVRGNTTTEKLAKLRPAFYKKHGTITAGNASFLTDGAAVVLLMSEEKAKELGIQPKAKIRHYTFTAHDPKTDLLLGPAFAIPKVLQEEGLSLEDMDVIELHEAFAAQVLSVIKCLESDEFGTQHLGLPGKFGEVPLEKLNRWGGSLSLGHPFGATGARLVTTAANRLHEENGQLAILAACAGGAHGHAMILERM